MTDLEMQAMEKLAAERDVARELCRDALAERDQALADYQSLGAEVLKLTAARDRALACEAAARGLLKSLAETILNIEGDRTSRGHEARSEAVIRACVRALSSPPSPTSAPDQEPGEGGPCLWCGKSYTAKAVDIAWDSGKHLVGVAECPACQYPALVKMDAPEVERGKCGKCPSCYGKGRYSLQFEDGGLCDRCGGTGRGGTNG